MSKLHLILPMAGRGSRFFKNGFVCPKPLIEINGKPFFYWAARSVEKFVDCADLTFVVLEEHIRDFAIDEKIKAYWPAARIVALPEVTEGAAVTALKGCEGLPDGEPILFNDCDHLFVCRAFNEFCAKGGFANGPEGDTRTGISARKHDHRQSAQPVVPDPCGGPDHEHPVHLHLPCDLRPHD